jgi:hypothetical protein
VSNAVLVLLQRAAARAPLLLIVDDLPWIDRASAGVLSFVARRLAGRGAGLLVACRTGADSYFDRAGLPEYELTPLDELAATELVAARFPGLDPLVRSRVLGVAQGNPLALLELTEALSDSQRSATEPLPSVLPLGQRLQRLFISRVTRLPPATRIPPGGGARGHGTCACSGGGRRCYRLEDLAPAERDHLVRVGPDPGRSPSPIRSSAPRGRGLDRGGAGPIRRWPPSYPPARAPGVASGRGRVADEHVAPARGGAHRSHQRGDYSAQAGLTRAAA